MAVNVYKQDYVYKTIQKNKAKIVDAKVTSVKDVDFNTMEGYTYVGVVKLVLVNGRSKLYRVVFYTGDMDCEDTTPQSYLESWLESCFN